MEKKSKLAYAKSVDSERKMVTGYVSTFDWDRMDERFAKGAWDLKAYLKNPIVLWGHESWNMPIGRNVDLVEDEKGLIAVTEFNRKDDKAMQVFQLFEDRYLNAFSVGFIPKEFQMEPMPDGERKGLVWTNAELYEYSAVSVPANPGALVGRELAEKIMKTVGPRYIEVLATKSLGEQFLIVPKDVAEKEAGPGEENGDEPAPTPEPEPNLEGALKGIITLANTAKGQDIPEQTRSLILTAHTVFSEIIAEYQEKITEEDLAILTDATKEFAGIVKDHNPEHAELITKSISKLENALRSRTE